MKKRGRVGYVNDAGEVLGIVEDELPAVRAAFAAIAPPKPHFDWVAHAHATVADMRLPFMLARDVGGVWYLLAATGSASARDVEGFAWLRLATPAESDPWQLAIELARYDEEEALEHDDAAVAAREFERLSKVAT